jgi:hypothetical protein
MLIMDKYRGDYGKNLHQEDPPIGNQLEALIPHRYPNSPCKMLKLSTPSMGTARK